MPHLVMSPQLYVLFSTLVEEASGIQYGAQDQQVFASKLTDHALDLGFASLLDYYYRLRYDDRDGNEMRRLVEMLVVGRFAPETSRFVGRDPAHERTASSTVTSSASSVSMNELTEKTALPAPATPYPGGGLSR